MFVELAQSKNGKYGGFDRSCDIFCNTKIGIFGRMDRESEKAWDAYIDLLGSYPIVCTEEVIRIMSRIISLNIKNANTLEIILFTDDGKEMASDNMRFIGYDVASSAFASVFSGNACCCVPERFTADRLNDRGLFDSLNDAMELSKYANSLDASSIEPDFPYRPVRVFLLR